MNHRLRRERVRQTDHTDRRTRGGALRHTDRQTDREKPTGALEDSMSADKVGVNDV